MQAQKTAPVTPSMVAETAWTLGHLDTVAHKLCATQPTCDRCPIRRGCPL